MTLKKQIRIVNNKISHIPTTLHVPTRSEYIVFHLYATLYNANKNKDIQEETLSHRRKLLLL